MNKLTFGILGAGCGGQSMAVLLKNQGCTVKLMDRDKELVRALCALDHLTLTGKIEMTGRPDLITDSAPAAIEGSDVILVVTTADGHEQAAREIAASIRPEQIVVLNPGMFCGSLAFKTALKKYGCPYDVVVAETADLMFACRKREIGVTFHSGLKKKMVLAAVPSTKAADIAQLLQPYFSIRFVPAPNILHTALGSVSVGLHCVPMLMNVNRFDAGQPFDYYIEGITPSIARISEKVDLERVALAKKLNIDVLPVMEATKNAYGLSGDTLYAVLQANQAYVGIKSPTDLSHRFCAEDTFGSLVGFATLAASLGVPTPHMDAVITLISAATGIDYWTVGRTAEKVGLTGLRVEEIYQAIR